MWRFLLLLARLYPTCLGKPVFRCELWDAGTESLNPKTLNPKTLNPKTLNPINPRP